MIEATQDDAFGRRVRARVAQAGQTLRQRVQATSLDACGPEAFAFAFAFEFSFA